ncbi:hypothetical protein CKAN_02393800 [Cinnamomum micranthum f. kanehirae]|uniref:Uncharacterized protein n=1 Tax=Cinnamomum micranthum f. kanehirae TaxID=337451 RepID=A0A443PV39_9MAGN|nr:hypothetical protein CKAN_02393800 [Cinnamomum micranthum f. kanehirae]
MSSPSSTELSAIWAIDKRRFLDIEEIILSRRRKDMGCVDSSKFSEPLPWIGLYIAAASLLCSLLMGLDTFNSFRRRKL